MTLPLFASERHPARTAIAIVGTREPTFWQICRVFDLVARSAVDATIVSGGARGIDSHAALAARFYGRRLVEFRPQVHDRMSYFERVAAMHARNGLVVGAAVVVEALPGPEYPRKGGTANAVKQACKLRRPTRIWGPDGEPFETFGVW